MPLRPVENCDARLFKFKCLGSRLIGKLHAAKSTWTVIPFYKRDKSREKLPRRLEGAKIFAMLSSPRNVGRLWGFSFLVDSFCGRDGAFGF